MKPEFISLQDWFEQFCRRLPPVQSLRSESPRFPVDELEAGRVYQHWDALNGRYYYPADVVLDDGMLLCDVLFDGDTNIALDYSGKPMKLQPRLYGRRITTFLVTKDCTPTRCHGEATREECEAFAETYCVHQAP